MCTCPVSSIANARAMPHFEAFGSFRVRPPSSVSPTPAVGLSPTRRTRGLSSALWTRQERGGPERREPGASHPLPGVPLLEDLASFSPTWAAHFPPSPGPSASGPRGCEDRQMWDPRGRAGRAPQGGYFGPLGPSPRLRSWAQVTPPRPTRTELGSFSRWKLSFPLP